MTDRLLTPVIVGPTGVGKTAVAVALAALTPLTVISADARQVYRGLDIGTAKPNPATTVNIGVIWPTWDSVNVSANTFLRQTRIPNYQCPSDPSLGTCIGSCRKPAAAAEQ